MSDGLSAHSGSVTPGVPFPIPYTAEEVGRTFAGLLGSFDFGAELRELGLGQWSPFKRSQAKKLLTAIYIALWRIALERSFPQDADAFYAHFVGTYTPLLGDGRSAKKLRDLVSRYDPLVAEKKDTDFTGVADALVKSLGLPDDTRRQRLKLSLRIRAAYDCIFARLI